jgi:hypothetical protein
MKSFVGTLAAPFPYFGGKSGASVEVWRAFGVVENYVEPFCGSAAMLLSAPDGRRVETINDADGFVVNFWRATAVDPDAVAHWADWPCTEADLEARHAWLVNRAERLRWQLEDPDFFDVKIAGWWCWGACNWIGAGWCSGDGPHVTNGVRLIDGRQAPRLNAGQGINRKLPHLGNAGQGINRKLPQLGNAGRDEHPRSAYIREWMYLLAHRLRDVRITCGDWQRVLTDAVTTRHGTTAVFLDPPYTRGAMDYAVGGVGGTLAAEVRAWCAIAGSNDSLRIVLCGHAGEHDELTARGWTTSRKWVARAGYASTDEALQNIADETLWCSPHCMQTGIIAGLFDDEGL